MEEWRGLVVIRAGSFFHGHRLADRHVAEHLARAGTPVLYVDPPVSPLRSRRDADMRAATAGPRLRVVGPRLARLTPSAPPGKTRRAVAPLTAAMLRHQMARACAALGGDVRAVLAVSGTPVFGACGERTSVFWARDDFAAGARLMNLPGRRTRQEEIGGAAAADLVIAVSPMLQEKWARRGHATVLVPNGCDTAAMAAAEHAEPPTDVRLSPPVAGVVGTIGERIDLPLLGALADRGHSLLLVGQRQKNLDVARLGRLLDRPNVQWTGHRPHEALPGYLRTMRVGLVPYADSAFNRASFPLKTLEYLAAGVSVVSTDLPASRWLGTDLVKVARGVAEFAAHVEHALTVADVPADRRRRRAFAAQHDWAHRAEDILAVLP